MCDLDRTGLHFRRGLLAWNGDVAEGLTEGFGGIDILWAAFCKDRLVEEDTAAKLDEMLHNDVVNQYGEGNFPGLDLCAKSGTAEVGDGNTPHSWFYGYIRNPGYPYAFVVLVENGGSGAEVAGDVANQVLQTLVNMSPMGD